MVPSPLRSKTKSQIRGKNYSTGMSPRPQRKDEETSKKTTGKKNIGKNDTSHRAFGKYSRYHKEIPRPGVHLRATRRTSSEVAAEISDLMNSYDFAEDEEIKRGLEEELEKLKKEEQEKLRDEEAQREKDEIEMINKEEHHIEEQEICNKEEQKQLQIEKEKEKQVKEEEERIIKAVQARLCFGGPQFNTKSPKPFRKKMEAIKDRPRVVLTWVGRRGGVKNIKKSYKELLKAAKVVLPLLGSTYAICEKFDTYQKGGLFPIFHVSKDSGVINKLMNSENGIDSEILGPENMVDQGVFEEVACIVPRMTPSPDTGTVLAVSAFKSIEPYTNATLIKEWKQWTGARAFLQEIAMAGLECKKIRFLIKISPSEEPEGFYYVLTTEVGIREPNDEGLFVDVLQRFRVERWFGYNTIYRKHKGLAAIAGARSFLSILLVYDGELLRNSNLLVFN
ncbi:hypothetical protein SK128_003318 [Halocaridina rubra]|uniref:DUF7153 domain-containing protein n=1 Tax=Halocaridina rubra TaxID=373956 RepID=A0AAN8XEY3_HALRR